MSNQIKCWFLSLKIKSKLCKYIHMECVGGINNMVSNECVSCDVIVPWKF